MSSPLLDRPGAVEADGGLDAGVAVHYGSSFAAEQRTLLSGEGFVDLSHRDVLRVTGPDRLTWLHSLTTQYLEGLAAGRWTDVLLLSPQGRIEHDFSGVDDGETFWAHTEPGAGAALITFLDRMRFMSRVEVAAVDDRFVVGRYADGLVTEFVDDLATVPGTPVGLFAWEALRIAAGRPRFGLDTDERTIPNEVGLLGSAVHLDKGCYRGQETVARVHNLGRPPRRLTLLHLDGSVDHLPPHGADVLHDGKVVGQVGSAARHHELGPIALALLKRNTPVDATLLADGVAAAQEPIVDPDAGLHVRAGLNL
ncbi:folate-binding protein [Aeromicrobium flavum]|uniref:Folate-binding protein n=1 Tax=Aeromicrobium flavum TaxID=416568 RepID=A0A512HT15_9ACTN|nr:glycine cleavage T C-terminal barrel domain-containing protein [Aeromicrobium flavum]GEO88545.1 folate-binding protein [Aeromicrobium flavum]